MLWPVVVRQEQGMRLSFSVENGFRLLEGHANPTKILALEPHYRRIQRLQTRRQSTNNQGKPRAGDC